jgi:hypothetical protein
MVREHLEDPGLYWRIILKWIFKKWYGAWIILIWLRIGAGAYCFKRGNKLSGSIKCKEFLD